MPITFDPRPEHNLCILVHRGEISDDEFLAFYRKLFQGDTIDPCSNLLVDLRETNSITRSTSVLRQFAGFMAASLKDLETEPKVAVVAPNALSYGLARMYEAFSDSVPWDFMVFRDIDPALEWLDLPKDLADRCNHNT